MTILLDLFFFLVALMLCAAIGLTFVRLVRGPSIADRVVALDLLSILGIGVVVSYAIWTNQPAFMDVAVILALIGFLSTAAFAYYIERRAEI